MPRIEETPMGIGVLIDQQNWIIPPETRDLHGIAEDEPYAFIPVTSNRHGSMWIKKSAPERQTIYGTINSESKQVIIGEDVTSWFDLQLRNPDW